MATFRDSEIANIEHNQNRRAKNVFVVNPSGAEDSFSLLSRFDFSLTDLVYTGKVTGSTSWTITLFDFSAGTTIYANNLNNPTQNNFLEAWGNRTDLVFQEATQII